MAARHPLASLPSEWPVLYVRMSESMKNFICLLKNNVLTPGASAGQEWKRYQLSVMKKRSLFKPF